MIPALGGWLYKDTVVMNGDSLRKSIVGNGETLSFQIMSYIIVGDTEDGFLEMTTVKIDHALLCFKSLGATVLGGGQLSMAFSLHAVMAYKYIGDIGIVIITLCQNTDKMFDFLQEHGIIVIGLEISVDFITLCSCFKNPLGGS